MDCERAQEWILESFDEHRPATMAMPAEMASHLHDCPGCQQFLARQQSIDARLTAMLPSPALSPAIVDHVRAQVREASPSFWRDNAPDLVHFASGGIATIWCALAFPFDTATVLAAGASIVLASYALLTAARHSLEGSA